MPIQSKANKQASPTGSGERAILRRIVNKDREALAEIYERYHSRLFKFIFRLTGSYAAADELVNDVMFLVWQKAGSFRGDSRVSTWVFGIAYRLSMQHFRRQRSNFPSVVDVDELPEEERQSFETVDWVEKGISLLPPAQRTTVILVFYAGLSYEETAQVTGCPVNTVKTRMFHARKKLKLLLADNAAPTALRGSDQ